MSGSPREKAEAIVVADVHLGPGDPDLGPFRRFLLESASQARTIVLLGDIFSVWLGRRKFTQEHHEAVLETCRRLRSQGTRVVLVEGNREFAARLWEGDAFDHVAGEWIVEQPGGGRWHLAHGDLLNLADRNYRTFRRLSRSWPVQAAVACLPRRRGLALASQIERRMRHTNIEYKTSLSEEQVAAYGRWLESRGFDGGAVGHIHVELDLPLAGGDGRTRRLYVLPDWRSGWRYLVVPTGGPPRFEAWHSGRPAGPAVVEVSEEGSHVRVLFERGVEAGPGDPVAIDCGHGPEVRRGRITSIGPGGKILELLLQPGPLVQVGDRLLGEGEGPSSDRRA